MSIEAENQSEDGAESGGDTLGVELALQRVREGAGARDAVADALLVKQTEKLEHELAHLKLRGINEWLAILLKGVGVALGLAVVVFVAAMAWGASQSHALIVEPFHTPPDFVAKGLDGTVLASNVLDKLEEMRSNTVSELATTSYSGEPASEAKLEIPDTGISLSELKRLLQEWLGHDTHISGSLVHAGDQLVLTARVDGAAKSFTGPEAELDRLVTGAAESVFAASQPLVFVDYLNGLHRRDEAIALLQQQISTGTRKDRAWAYLGLGEQMERRRDYQAARYAYNEAASLDPSLWSVWEALADLENYSVNHDEASLPYRRRAAAATDFGGADPNIAHHLHILNQISLDEAAGDFASALALAEKEATEEPAPEAAYQSAYYAGFEAGYQHDIGLAHLWMQRTMDRAISVRPTSNFAQDGGSRERDREKHRLTYWQLADVEDWAGAAKEMAIAEDGLSSGSITYWLALEAIALARSGQPDAAKALTEPMPPNYCMAMVARGMTAEAKGDRGGADRFFQAAVRDAPSFVRFYDYWARVKLARGDTAGALAIFQQAHDKGPHYADALEGWGEVLLRTGDAEGAVAKFRDADHYAPHWGRNHLEWGQALWQLGRRDDARAQFAAAGGLGLSAADRKTLSADQARS